MTSEDWLENPPACPDSKLTPFWNSTIGSRVGVRVIDGDGVFEIAGELVSSAIIAVRAEAGLGNSPHPPAKLRTSKEPIANTNKRNSNPNSGEICSRTAFDLIEFPLQISSRQLIDQLSPGNIAIIKPRVSQINGVMSAIDFHIIDIRHQHIIHVFPGA